MAKTPNDPASIDFDNLDILVPCQSETDHQWVESNGLDGDHCPKCGMFRTN